MIKQKNQTRHYVKHYFARMDKKWNNIKQI